ncbi:hypothetical protein M431DRAFT_543246 [Trichoderma harzianum CBS 226.95]|uniref:Uncharacterized protein n=1 Tax=Trichoderma harzianum CBS 226.95 TaxID=983964 RepID=A0A2T3ZWN5_TRIHA|nr:hypothetical protein M431DRAFT_543246 [Trichoderma harzianum CBS 226.95]PTB49225.1 hypothetical protein M431DRAFT_543246 [Trichoderma harzianum CBS 226.95]
MDLQHPQMEKTTYAFKFPLRFPATCDSLPLILHSAKSTTMSPNRQEMRNDALSRIGLPIIPVDPAPQASEWNDDETTLVTSASLSFSTFSIDDTAHRLHRTDDGLLVVDNDFYPDPLFREELAEFLNTHFGNYREAVDRGSRNLTHRLNNAVAFGTVDLDAGLQGENRQGRPTTGRGSRVYHWILSHVTISLPREGI